MSIAHTGALKIDDDVNRYYNIYKMLKINCLAATKIVSIMIRIRKSKIKLYISQSFSAQIISYLYYLLILSNAVCKTLQF